MSDESPKIEFFADNGIIEIRYFDNPKDRFYRSWKLPEDVADELTAWWARMEKDNAVSFPLQTRKKTWELTMHAGTHIEIKSLDCKGRTGLIGWSLPEAVLMRLSLWRRNNG